jgi:hypothetical protein
MRRGACNQRAIDFRQTSRQCAPSLRSFLRLARAATASSAVLYASLHRTCCIDESLVAGAGGQSRSTERAICCAAVEAARLPTRLVAKGASAFATEGYASGGPRTCVREPRRARGHLSAAPALLMPAVRRRGCNLLASAERRSSRVGLFGCSRVRGAELFARHDARRTAHERVRPGLEAREVRERHGTERRL